VPNRVPWTKTIALVMVITLLKARSVRTSGLEIKVCQLAKAFARSEGVPMLQEITQSGNDVDDQRFTLFARNNE
jgi:hypothetical protein